MPDGDSPPAVDPEWHDTWPQLAELGITGLCVPAAAGGFGLRADAAAVVASQLGAALHGSPFAALTASAYALAHADDSTSTDLVAGIVAGEKICSFGRLHGTDGRAFAVCGAAHADALLLLDDTTGNALLAADRSAWSERKTRPVFDVTRACADVTIDLDACRPVQTTVDPWPLYDLLLAADALGGVHRSLDRAIIYSRQREAFGRPIGGFQAVQHRLVDHTVRTRGMALAVNEAARTLTAGSPAADQSVTVASLAVSEGAVRILHDLVQLTGGIGFTWEHGLHLFERRAHADAVFAANPRRAVRALAVEQGWCR